MEENSTSTPIMSEIVTFFKYVGQRQQKTMKSTMHTIIVHTLFVCCLLLCLIPQWLVILTDKYDTFDKAEALSIIMPMSRVLIKVMDRIIKMDKFWDFYAYLQQINDFNSRDPLTKIALEKRAKVARRLFITFAVMYVIISIMFIIVPFAVGTIFMLLGNPDVFKPIFKAEYYIDTSKNPAFAIVYVSQSMAAFCSMYVGVMDGIFLSSCVYVHAQAAIVAAEFQNLSDDNDESRNEPLIVSKRKRDLSLRPEEQLKRDTEDLKTCIQHHARLIALVEKFESVFSVQIGFECLITAGLTCLAVFQTTYTTDLAGKCKYLGAAIIFYAGVYIQIYHGQKLIDESARLLQAVYELPWAGRGRGRLYGRLVVQAMQRAQRPLCITGMRLYIISSETFLKLLRATFSYLTLMQSVVVEK